MVRNKEISYLLFMLLSDSFSFSTFHQCHSTKSNQIDPISGLDLFSICPGPSVNISRTLRYSDANGFLYTSYQRTIECRASFPPIRPKDLGQLKAAVRFALENNFRIKAVGSRHSITDAICTDGILLDMTQINHFSFDPQTNQATVGTGMTMFDFLGKLHKNGRGIPSSPAFGGVTVGGAVSMGSHGSNLKQPASPSDLLVSVLFVDGMGKIRRVSEGEEEFKALKVNLGLLGIVYELVFTTTEQYKIEMKTNAVDDTILWSENKLQMLAESNDFFQFFWFPTNKQVIMSVGRKVPVHTPGNCQSYLSAESPFIHSNRIGNTVELLQAAESDVGYFIAQTYAKLSAFRKVPFRNPVYSGVDDEEENCLPLAVGYSHRMMTSKCHDCPWKHGDFSLVIEDIAVAIDVGELSKAMITLKEILGRSLVAFPIIGIFFRFMKASDSYLGSSSNRTTVEIEWVTIPRFDRTHPKLGIATFQAIGQALVERHGGRPAWSKGGLYYSSAEVIHRAYPNVEKFVKVMKRMDPHELFINEFGRRIKYKSSEMTLSRAAKKRCALNEACLCTQDSDCGAGEDGDHVCEKFMEFKVCRKRLSSLEKLMEFFATHFVSIMASVWNYILSVLGLLIPIEELVI